MTIIKDYHTLYLKCDVLLLPDVFEIFRNRTLKNYGLYPSHCLSAQTISWDAMFNMTKVEFEIISDADLYLLFVREAEFLTFLSGIV